MRLFFLSICAFISVHLAHGQVLFPGDYTRDYYKLLILKNTDITDPINLFPSIIDQYDTKGLEWDIWNGKVLSGDSSKHNKLTILNPTSSFILNSKYAKGINDGAAWVGKGWNMSFSGGVSGRLGILYYTVAPIIYYSRNEPFFIPDSGFSKNEFSYPFVNNIDWVVRYGSDPFYSLHPGQSDVRLVHKGITLGISTQNMNWGPAQFNPILMSINAPGFPHLDLGTHRPIKTKIGHIEFKTYWGILSESDYFDANPDNNKRYFTGLTFGYQPNFIEGLSLGVNRALYTSWSLAKFRFKDVLSAFSGPSGAFDENVNGSITNDAYDQLLSLTMRWTFKDKGFETYLEFARNDFPDSFKGLIRIPDHSRGFNLGLIKIFDLANGNVMKFVYEHTNLSQNLTTREFTPSVSYYVHHIVKQGYTHEGQILGASNGPGTSSDFIQMNIYRPNGVLGFNVQRLRYNDDYIYKQNRADINLEYEYTLGVNYLRFFGNVSLQAELLWSYRASWYYDFESDVYNTQTSIKVGYQINKKTK